MVVEDVVAVACEDDLVGRATEDMGVEVGGGVFVVEGWTETEGDWVGGFEELHERHGVGTVGNIRANKPKL